MCVCEKECVKKSSRNVFTIEPLPPVHSCPHIKVRCAQLPLSSARDIMWDILFRDKGGSAAFLWQLQTEDINLQINLKNSVVYRHCDRVKSCLWLIKNCYHYKCCEFLPNESNPLNSVRDLMLWAILRLRLTTTNCKKTPLDVSRELDTAQH